MGLEAQEVAVRFRVLGGSAFRTEADSIAGSITKVEDAAKKGNVSSGGLLSTLNNAGKTAHTMGAKMERAGQHIRTVGRNLSMLGVPILYIGYTSVKASMQFQQAMELLQTQAGDSTKDIRFLTKHVGEMAGALGTKPTDLAAGLYAIVSSGLHGQKALDALRASAMGAKIGIDTLTNTSQALMGIYNTHMQGTGNFMQIMSTIDALVGKGMMHLPDLMEAMHSEIVPLAKDVGLHFGDIGTAIAAMTRMNIPAQRAANLMKLTLTKMFAPTGAGLKALEMIGLSQFQLASDLHHHNGLITALTDLESHLHRVPGFERNAVLAAAFGQSRGVSNIASLLNALPTMRTIQGYVNAYTPATFNQHFRQTSQTSAFKFAQIQAQWQQLMITLGTAVIPVLLPLLKNLTTILGTVVHWFNSLSPGLRHTIIKILALTIILGPVVWVFGILVTVIGAAITAFGFIAGLLGAEGALATAIPALAAMFGGVAVEGGVVMASFVALVPVLIAAGVAIAGFIAIWNARHTIEHAGYSVGHAVAKFLLGTPHHTTFLGKALQDLGILGNGPRATYFNTKAFHHMNTAQKDAILRLANKGGQREWTDRFGQVWVGTGAQAMPLSYYQNIFRGVSRSQLPGWLHVPHMLTMSAKANLERQHLPSGVGTKGMPHLTGSSMRPSLDHVRNSLSGFEITVNSNTYLDGKLVARSVNKANRETANRR